MVSELDLPASFSGSFCATRGEVLLVPLSPSDSSSSAVKASMVVVMFPTNMSIWVSSATPDRTACLSSEGLTRGTHAARRRSTAGRRANQAQHGCLESRMPRT